MGGIFLAPSWRNGVTIRDGGILREREVMLYKRIEEEGKFWIL
jgi:hypothetical protein